VRPTQLPARRTGAGHIEARAALSRTAKPATGKRRSASALGQRESSQSARPAIIGAPESSPTICRLNIQRAFLALLPTPVIESAGRVTRRPLQETLMRISLTHVLKSSVLGLALIGAPAFAQQDLEAQMKSTDRASDSNVELRNNSNWALKELFFAPVGSDHWGPNQLSHDIIRPDDSFTLTGIRCDKYDVKLVDEDDNECIVRDVSLCAQDKTWRISDHSLDRCQRRTER
jgi:hypothetical protein